MIVSVAMGTAVTASLLTLSFDIKGKVSKELRSFGANITIEPRIDGMADLAGVRRYLSEQDVTKAKAIFWRHNIIGIAPFFDDTVEIQTSQGRIQADAIGGWHKKDLPLPGESSTFEAGIATVMPWWELNGDAPDARNVVLGISLAERLKLKTGDAVAIDNREFRVSGVMTTGGPEDDKIFIDLDALQELKNKPDAITRVQVSALTTPMDNFAYKDPSTMSKTEYEKWYCTGYVTSIAKQLEEAFRGSRARPIWQVAQSEGRVLNRLAILVYLLTAAALIGSALGMSTTMAASLLRRLDEIGLMKSIGADGAGITIIFISESLIIGLSGGIIGYALSFFVSKYIGLQVFDTALADRGLLFPISLISSLSIAALGSLIPIKRALRVKPAVVLKESH